MGRPKWIIKNSKYELVASSMLQSYTFGQISRKGAKWSARAGLYGAPTKDFDSLEDAKKYIESECLRV